MNLHPSETGSKPAPGQLALIQAFVNTYDVESRRDSFASPDLLRDWLVSHELVSAATKVEAEDLSQVRGMREALRALLLANNGGSLEADAVTTLNRAAGTDPLVVRFSGDGGAKLEPQTRGVRGALGQLLAIVFTSMAEGTWSRLKACLNDECHWAFYDSSKNRSGTWCTMAVCGSRMKARAYRQRKVRADA